SPPNKPVADRSGRRAAIREGPDDLVEIVADQQLLLLEVPQPGVVVAIGLGEERIQVDEPDGDGGNVALVGLFLGMREDTQPRGRHEFFLLLSVLFRCRAKPRAFSGNLARSTTGDGATGPPEAEPPSLDSSSGMPKNRKKGAMRISQSRN